MEKLAGYLDSISKPRYEEDFVDRLNYRVTAYILLAAAVTLSAKVRSSRWLLHKLQFIWSLKFYYQLLQWTLCRFIFKK